MKGVDDPEAPKTTNIDCILFIGILLAKGQVSGVLLLPAYLLICNVSHTQGYRPGPMQLPYVCLHQRQECSAFK